ncbi:MAG: TlpA disulfide reductase family protein, partial [Planctomycetota bacterium]|nr:TlpA disulfide reductase family protein [Planctomycetota bacterium]
MRNIIFSCTALALLALAPIPQEPPTLVVGSIAPPIDSLELVQGEFVSNPKVRVVEFWATWCGPCKQSIPHINELYQSQQPNGLEVIGVSDETRAKVEPFVRKQGSQMSYTVALDSGKKVSSAYMQAAGQNGIPCAFVIGQNNKIVYIGHPMDPEFTNAVKLSLTGRYDPKLSKQAAPLLDAARNAIKAKNFKDGYRRFDEVIALDPMIFSDIALEKYRVMLNEEKNTAGAKNYAKEMSNAFVAAGDTVALRDLALTLSSDPRVSIYDNDLALVAAEAMLKSSSSSDPSANATLASVHYARGDFAKAVEAQKKAMRLASPNA